MHVIITTAVFESEPSKTGKNYCHRKKIQVKCVAFCLQIEAYCNTFSLFTYENMEHAAQQKSPTNFLLEITFQSSFRQCHMNITSLTSFVLCHSSFSRFNLVTHYIGPLRFFVCVPVSVCAAALLLSLFLQRFPCSCVS